MFSGSLFRAHVALPPEHGAWVFLFSPLVLGAAAAGSPPPATLVLVVAATCGFLVRQPITLAVKVASGRRGRDVLPAVAVWIAIYAAIGGAAATALVLLGHGDVLWLALPGAAVLGLHLGLVARRRERRQLALELVAAGALALAAPAAYRVGLGRPSPIGWWLWALAWAQSAASIVHAFLRLRQRALSATPAVAVRLREGGASLVVASANLVAVALLGIAGRLPGLLWAAYLIQWIEVVLGVARPAVGWKPRSIGLRQLAVSAAFTATFVLAWWA